MTSFRPSLRLLLGFLLSATLHGAEPTPAKAPTIFLIGDSTVTNQALIPARVLRGWGQMLPLYLKPGIRVENHASSGHSSKSFIGTGRWQKVHESLKPGDYLIIQFGHNDGKPDEKRATKPFGEYTENLKRYVREARDRGATPILATPPCRCIFGKDGTLVDTHLEYPEAARQVAEKEQVPLLDLEAKTAALLRHMGPERSRTLFAGCGPGDYPAEPKGRQDGTHFNALGASRVCDFAVEDIQAKVPGLAQWLLSSAREPVEP